MMSKFRYGHRTLRLSVLGFYAVAAIVLTNIRRSTWFHELSGELLVAPGVSKSNSNARSDT